MKSRASRSSSVEHSSKLSISRRKFLEFHGSCLLLGQTACLLWRLDSCRACPKRSPAHSAPDVPRFGFVKDARTSERCGLLVWIAKPVPTPRWWLVSDVY